MSKKLNIDFSIFDESEYSINHWTPAAFDYTGAYGNAEAQYATANFLNIGDVGDPEWREARRLPFGDEALDALYPGSRTLSFIQYPWEHPDADQSDAGPVNRMIESDPALEWTLTEMSKLEARGEVGSDRYNSLAEMVAEIRGYEARQIEEEGFIHAPSWAMDAILYAQEHAYDAEATRLVEEFTASGANAGRVISSVPYADVQSVKVMRDIHDEYEIKLPEGSRQHGFALRDGKKVFGPYGPRISAFKLYKSPNTFQPNASNFRLEEMHKVLQSSGILPIYDQDGNLDCIDHIPVTPDNLLEAKKNYSYLADVINEANGITAFVVAHIKLLTEDLYWDKLKQHLVSDGSYKDVMAWSADLSADAKPAPCLRAIGHDGLSELIDDYLSLQTKINKRINTNYYILIVGKNTTLGITSSKEAADVFKTGNAEDVLYFMLPKNLQDKLGYLSKTVEMYGYDSAEYTAWKDTAFKYLNSPKSKYRKDTIQNLVKLYNSNRRVKSVTSRTMREYGWLLNELPFARKEISILSDCLEAYGRAIVSAQQKVPVVRQVFNRLKNVVEQDILSNRVPDHALRRIAKSGTTSFVYKVKSKPIPDDAKTKKSMYEAGLVSPEELRNGNYLAIKLYYDYDFAEPSDVFRFVSNFNATPNAIKLANEKLNC
ncbi:MAG: hypothetical protein EB127_02725 [Alphaproteobacteria bacterium]|nr:hypothetical protein [Alphaproteobacteria bacterium]